MPATARSLRNQFHKHSGERIVHISLSKASDNRGSGGAATSEEVSESFRVDIELSKDVYDQASGFRFHDSLTPEQDEPADESSLLTVNVTRETRERICCNGRDVLSDEDLAKYLSSSQHRHNHRAVIDVFFQVQYSLPDEVLCPDGDEEDGNAASSPSTPQEVLLTENCIPYFRCGPHSFYAQTPKRRLNYVRVYSARLAQLQDGSESLPRLVCEVAICGTQISKSNPVKISTCFLRSERVTSNGGMKRKHSESLPNYMTYKCLQNTVTDFYFFTCNRKQSREVKFWLDKSVEFYISEASLASANSRSYVNSGNSTKAPPFIVYSKEIPSCHVYRSHDLCPTCAKFVWDWRVVIDRTEALPASSGHISADEKHPAIVHRFPSLSEEALMAPAVHAYGFEHDSLGPSAMPVAGMAPVTANGSVHTGGAGISSGALSSKRMRAMDTHDVADAGLLNMMTMQYIIVDGICSWNQLMVIMQVMSSSPFRLNIEELYIQCDPNLPGTVPQQPSSSSFELQDIHLSDMCGPIVAGFGYVSTTTTTIRLCRHVEEMIGGIPAAGGQVRCRRAPCYSIHRFSHSECGEWSYSGKELCDEETEDMDLSAVSTTKPNLITSVTLLLEHKTGAGAEYMRQLGPILVPNVPWKIKSYGPVVGAHKALSRLPFHISGPDDVIKKVRDIVFQNHQDCVYAVSFDLKSMRIGDETHKHGEWSPLLDGSAEDTLADKLFVYNQGGQKRSYLDVTSILNDTSMFFASAPESHSSETNSRSSASSQDLGSMLKTLLKHMEGGTETP